MNQLCRGWTRTPWSAAAAQNATARACFSSPGNDRFGSWTGPVWLTGTPAAAASRAMPSRSRVPVRVMAGTAPSSRRAVIVATDAAIGTDWNQNEPVTKIRAAASAYRASPGSPGIP